MKKFCFFLIVGYITCSLSVYSQVSTQTNLLRAMSQQEAANYAIKKAQAVEWANRNGVPVTIEIKGSFLEIQYIDANGRPQYYKTDNINAAVSISTNKVYTGGGAGLNLSGSGITVREWDAGSVLPTHQEFGNRITVADAVSSHGHSTHVAGTIMAAGVDPSAKGMAFGANLRSFDWDYDVSEMASEAAAGALISNHSYGWVRGWYWNGSEYVWFGDPGISNDEDYLFGFYDISSQQWDMIAQNAPYFLICKAAGNDRYESGEGHPPDGPYDCIDQTGIAKNILTVGAVNDIPGGYTTPSSVEMTSFSSWGPADDGRIKPDIVANGTGLYSAYNTDNSSYETMSGTSMATPSVSGSLALLQQHYYALKGGYMRSATAKALVIHTADETGYYMGPDYMFGWGLMNTKQAAWKISEDQSNDVISELNLNNGTTYSRNVIASGLEPLKVTIVWTDPAGTPPAPALDPITPMLVNDLDLRITRSGSTFYPWKLDRDNPSYPATNDSKNSVDNVEVIYIANPEVGGIYTLHIDHAGTLSGGSQPYSMIISGITNEVPAPNITLTLPNGGEAWEVGSTHNITWTSLGTSGTVKIEYSTNNGTSWANILASTPDDGSQSWTIPDAPSTSCLIRISDTDGSPVGVNNTVFSIVTPAPRTLIAHYPLVSNANDITGKNNPMTLTNAPFQNGGIYCNGIYNIADPVNGCLVMTPYSLAGFNINSFEISTDFMLTELFPGANSPLPVFVGGSSNRWIGFCHYYDQGSQKISLLTNNSSYTSTQTSLNLNQWYNAKIVYNGLTAFLYLDNQLICSKDVTLFSNGDYNISATNYSNGKVFKGYLKDLKVSTITFSPEITVNAPNGGENWQVGSSHNITWTSLGTSGNVRIEYSINNGTSWTNIITSTPNDGSYTWTIPDAPATTCLVRVSDADDSPVDVSNALFTISSLPANSLIAYYPFNGNANDNSTYGNNGIVNGATFTSDRFGNPDSAVYFNGTDNYINCGNNISINPSNALSISCWIKSDAYKNSRIISKWGLNSGYEMTINNSVLCFALNQECDVTCDMTQYEGKWTFITGTWDGNNVHLFVNGILQLSSPQAAPLSSSPNNLLIGEMSNFTDSYFNGKIDDIRLFNKALSESEISAFYQEGGWPYATVPTLTTTVISSLTQTSANSGGIISDDGGSAITARGVCWNTSPDPKVNLVTKTADGTGSGSFTSAITGLTAGTTYYLRAYATNNIGTSYGDNVILKTYNSDAIQDADGNYYNLVTIGSQVWMAENLKTTQYYDMTAIPMVTDNTEWSTVTTPAYCWYENNATSYKDQYGGLYNWYAVNTGKLCPAGWHVPTEAEWTIATTYLGGESVAGGKLKSTGTLEGGDGLWFSPNTGATNESGFTGFPGGYRGDEFSFGNFVFMNMYGYWWNSIEYDATNAWGRSLHYNNSTLHSIFFDKHFGFSVRCLKDNSSVSHFVPVWSGSGTDHMNLYALTAKLDNIDLQPGDEIGVFDGNDCVGMGTLTQVLTGSVYLSMVASKDDPDTPAKDGYTEGNAISFKIWDSSAGSEVSNAQAAYLSGTGIFAAGATSAFNLNALTSITHDISLSTGWNIMSFAAEPDNMSLMSIVTTLKNAGTLVKIQDEKGNAIEQLPAPIGWVDNIGLMKISEGYKIKVSANATLSTTGKPVTLPNTITLETGWNIMGYPSMTSQAALAAYQSLIDAGTLLKVQDEKGNAIEKLPAPIGWIDNIHNLLPGEGYKIKTNASTSITINNSGKGENQFAETEKIRPAHFKPVYKGNGLDQMNIYVQSPTIDGVGLKAGDEIGVFDGKKCVGAVVVDDPNLGYYTIIASLDDPSTTETDGFTEGNAFDLRLWDAQTGSEGKVKRAVYQKGYTSHFEKLGTSVLTADFTKESINVLGDAFPNPSSDKTTFTIQVASESQVQLGIYDINGHLIMLLVDQKMPGGIYKMEWNNRSANGVSASSGIYFYRLKLNNFMQTKQLVIR